MKKQLIIVAGGSGSRMQSDLPKQFITIHNKAILIWTIEAFLNYDKELQVVLVLPEEHFQTWKNLAKGYPSCNNILLVAGGSSRFHSVKNGLAVINSTGLVAIHDAVRPLVSEETIARCFKEAERNNSAIPVIDSEDTLRQETEIGSIRVDRNNFKRVQTPQVFNTEMLKKAYQISSGENATDDASVFEACFGMVQLVNGNRENIKLTYPIDIQLAKLLLSS